MKLAVPSSIELGSDRAAAAGCIAGVLRRILCRSVRQRRSRDENEEVGTWSGRYQREQGKKSKAASSSVSSPGIVARLMGLESSAVFPYAQPEVISRTRSASSAEAWQGPRLLGEGRSGNGDSQLRKSQSFREVPSYLRKESEEFLVLTFGKYDDGESSELSAKKMGLGVEQCNMKESWALRQMAEKKRSGNKMSENDAGESKECDAKNSVSPFGKEISGSEKGMEPIEMVVGSGSCRKKLSFAQGDMEMECSSDNSSPVSVFDLPIHADCENLIIPDASVSACEASVRKSEKEESRYRVSSEVEEDCKKARKCEMAARDLSLVWASICRIGEEHLIESNWLTKKLGKSEEAQELGFAIGHGILDLLLHETVIDLFNK